MLPRKCVHPCGLISDMRYYVGEMPPVSTDLGLLANGYMRLPTNASICLCTNGCKCLHTNGQIEFF